MILVAHNCPACGPVLGDLCREDMSVACAILKDWKTQACSPGCGKRLCLCRAHGLRTAAEPGACGCIEAAKNQTLTLS